MYTSYLSADPSACRVLHSSRFDTNFEVKRKAKRNRAEAQWSEADAKAKRQTMRREQKQLTKPARSAWAALGVPGGSLRGRDESPGAQGGPCAG